jgi:hypothetical protein
MTSLAFNDVIKGPLLEAGDEKDGAVSAMMAIAFLFPAVLS